jgi:hypothetical protein
MTGRPEQDHPAKDRITGDSEQLICGIARGESQENRGKTPDISVIYIRDFSGIEMPFSSLIMTV